MAWLLQRCPFQRHWPAANLTSRRCRIRGRNRRRTTPRRHQVISLHCRLMTSICRSQLGSQPRHQMSHRRRLTRVQGLQCQMYQPGRQAAALVQQPRACILNRARQRGRQAVAGVLQLVPGQSHSRAVQGSKKGSCLLGTSLAVQWVQARHQLPMLAWLMTMWTWTSTTWRRSNPQPPPLRRQHQRSRLRLCSGQR